MSMDMFECFAEILLPQILKEETPVAANSNTMKLEILPTVSKCSKNINQNTSDSNHMEASSSKAAVRNNSTDAFEFVTEMKLQMSQPQNTPESSSKRSYRKEGSKGGNRPARKNVQSKNTDHIEGTPNNRRPATESTPVKANSQNINTMNTRSRGGYSQAVKRSPLSGDCVTPKTSHVSRTNPANSESQKY